MSLRPGNNNEPEAKAAPPHPPTGLSKVTYPLSKTILDYLLIIPAFLLLTPLFLLISVFIWLDSAGPIFIRRLVMGRNGRQFTALQFRTREANPAAGLLRPVCSDDETTPSQPGDPRLTRVGCLLHRYGLQELPLLFNVLKRDMSLIGPRLISPPETVRYGRHRPAILQAYPGLTGLWQIKRGRENRLQTELSYVEQWSIWLDVKILLLTVPAVINP
jgi:lipopolysaccharide/colanic/teichoic acid biosynthesis glycosyltransferase